ncbi:M55 family metallopeptidase [Inediibacterium massiliense]|uniref:M55 family metallopeptidase n=1 Tax=Inediibacterium massiliense TaxID=1658111 RepID=UPI0006B5698F|nr:M55 family metallopeptidase [Inediibacterium massiliense]
MKIYISVDMEGITGVTHWNETILGHSEHQWAKDQMTKETIAACEAAIEMGAKEIFVKDAHSSGRNIDITKLPIQANVIRGWTGSPESMMAGIDSSYDACIFIGYHSPSRCNGNPLSHTMNPEKPVYVKINGEISSEFTMNAYIAAYYNVPVIFLSGDEVICNQSKDLISNIEIVSVKKCDGDATFNIHPEYACECIKNGVKEGMKKIQQCKIQSPKEFEMEIRFQKHQDAKRASYYPGVTVIDDYTVKYKAKDIQDMMTARMFIL